MKSFISSLIFLTLALTVFGQRLNVTNTLMENAVHRISSIIIGDHLYFSDESITLRSRDQAVAFCKSQGAELAKVTNRQLYESLRLALSTIPRTYWIDGIDKENHERFATTNPCTNGELDFTGIPANNLVLPARTCLTLVKGTTARNSRIEAMDCVIPNRVLCSYNLSGCEPITTTTMMPGGGD